MGVDCKITLPANVRLKDVADVIGVAAGFKPEKSPLGSRHPDSWAVHVPGVRVSSFNHAGLESCAKIELVGETVDGVKYHYAMYHFEYDDGKRLLNPRSTAFWLGIGHRLVDFFGGSLDYQDCDDSDKDYHVLGKHNRSNQPTDGKDWQDLQERMFAVKPLTKSELKRFDKLAAYKMETCHDQ